MTNFEINLWIKLFIVLITMFILLPIFGNGTLFCLLLLLLKYNGKEK